MNTNTKTAERSLFDSVQNAKPDLSEMMPGAGMLRTGKSSAAFRTISEVADELGVQQHVLRFWETKFSQVKPLKRGGGRRYYRPEDVQLLQTIHRLLYTEGYTIKGVQKLLRDIGKKQLIEGFLPETKDVQAPLTGAAVTKEPSAEQKVAVKAGLSAEQRQALHAVLEELKELRGMIKSR